VCDFEASSDSFDAIGSLVLEKVGDRVLRGDDELRVSEGSLATFEFAVGFEFISPDLEVMREAV